MSVNNCILYLNKNDSYWRMDGTTFICFMSHVSIYFKILDKLKDIVYEDVNYVDIAGEDLHVVCSIFGGYSPDDSKLLLVPVSPSNFVSPWKNTFFLNVIENKDTLNNPNLILMKSK